MCLLDLLQTQVLEISSQAAPKKVLLFLSKHFLKPICNVGIFTAVILVHFVCDRDNTEPDSFPIYMLRL